jgi:AcrR family transcriptional regulator
MFVKNHQQNVIPTGEYAVEYGFAAHLRLGAEALRKGERTRTGIAVAACECLDEGALADLTIEAICARAGISHGTFYIYFKNRNALVADVLFRFVDFVQGKMRAASHHAPEGAVRATTATYTHIFEANLGLMKCLLHHPGEFPEAGLAFQKLNREWLETVVAVREQALRKEGRSVDRAELMRRAYALGGMVDQYLNGLLIEKDPNMAAFSQDRVALVETFSFLWERGLDA